MSLLELQGLTKEKNNRSARKLQFQNKPNILLYIIGLFAVISFVNCAKTSQYNFSLKNTLSIFMISDGKNYQFAIPVQYIGDYHIGSFEFDNGYIAIGDYKIVLERGDINIDVFLNESSDESGNTNGVFNLVHSEKNGKILISKMQEPLTIKNKDEQTFNQYNIIITKSLNNKEIRTITNEYNKVNMYSQFYLGYTITIDNERMEGCGYSDDFELYNGPAEGTDWYPPNLEFFKTNVLGKG
jgi:hypothetical protein